jgi:hypothetical protein
MVLMDFSLLAEGEGLGGNVTFWSLHGIIWFGTWLCDKSLDLLGSNPIIEREKGWSNFYLLAARDLQG